MKTINILVRTSKRPLLFKRCIESVKRQTHSDIRVVVAYDDDFALSYIPDDIEKIKVEKSSSRFFYNLYCNALKEMVTDGWFFFLDDDDHLLNPKVLQQVSEHLFDGCLITQFVRGGRPKPKDQMMDAKKIEAGYIGLPTIFLHHKYKNIADLDGDHEFGDYTYIKKVSQLVETRFVKIPVVVAEKRNWGKAEIV